MIYHTAINLVTHKLKSYKNSINIMVKQYLELLRYSNIKINCGTAIFNT